MWLVWNVPLGLLAPHVFGFAIGAKHRKELRDSGDKVVIVRGEIARVEKAENDDAQRGH